MPHMTRLDGQGRMADDVYLTDYPTIRRTLDRFVELYPHYGGDDLAFKPHILDPGAGTGRWGEVCRERWPGARIDGVDIRGLPKPDAYTNWHTGMDFLNAGLLLKNDREVFPKIGGRFAVGYDLVIGNPPFKLAEPIIRESLGLVAHHGHVVLLLELRFLESRGRGAGLFAEHPPRFIHVCSRRPSFQEDGKTKPMAYAVFHWEKGYRGRPEVTFLTQSLQFRAPNADTVDGRETGPGEAGLLPSGPTRREGSTPFRGHPELSLDHCVGPGLATQVRPPWLARDIGFSTSGERKRLQTFVWGRFFVPGFMRNVTYRTRTWKPITPQPILGYLL